MVELGGPSPGNSGVQVVLDSVSPKTALVTDRITVRTTIRNPNAFTGPVRRQILLSQDAAFSSGSIYVLGEPPSVQLSGTADRLFIFGASPVGDALPPGTYFVAEQLMVETSGEIIRSNALPIKLIDSHPPFDVGVTIDGVDPATVPVGSRIQPSSHPFRDRAVQWQSIAADRPLRGPNDYHGRSPTQSPHARARRDFTVGPF